MSDYTTLYRMFDDEDHLLYVGITGNVGRRMNEHSKDKWWHHHIAYVKVEHFRSREEAQEAEIYAIRTEYPAYNIQHTEGMPMRPPEPSGPKGEWEYESKRSGFKHKSDLWLRPELECESYVDRYEDCSGRVQFKKWFYYVMDKFPDEVANDALPILWMVEPIKEFAPRHYAGDGRKDFLDRFTWPSNEKHQIVDWYSLPVRHDRFPKFSQFLGWKPSPLQPTCPIKSIAWAKDCL